MHSCFDYFSIWHKSFCGATDTPVLDFWWRLPWFLEWAALFALGQAKMDPLACMLGRLRATESSTYSLNLLLWIFMTTAGRLSPPPCATGLFIPELIGLPPGDSGDMLMGDVWLIGDMSALIGVHDPAGSILDVLELPPVSYNYNWRILHT